VNEVVPRLRESFSGYCLTDTDGVVNSIILANSASDSDDIYLILKYAKEFLNKQKL
jgi:hypothetical protein